MLRLPAAPEGEIIGRAGSELRRAFPDLTVHVFEGMGHGENAEHPELVVRQIKEFMNW